MLRVYLQNSYGGDIFEITDLCGDITYESYLKGQPGKLTTLIQKDPNEKLSITNGSKIMLQVNGTGVFFGYIFILETDATNTYKITAYDQMRYLKNEAVYVTSDVTASQIFTLVCEQFELQNEVKFNTSFVPPKHLHDKETGYSIIEYGITHELINTGNYCFVRDDYGTLIFSELKQEKTDLIIGDKSLLMNYTYEISIDKDTFNGVRIFKNDEETGKRMVWEKIDSNNQIRWGKLTLLQEADKNMNEGQIVELAKNLLKVKNRETKTMKLNVLGVKGLESLKAGNGFLLKINSLAINEDMWISSITHTFSKDLHLMQLEVFI